VTARRLLVLLLLAASALVGAAPAAAQTPAVTLDDGWWWSLQPEPPALPSPPTVPEDGLRVSSSPAGESSVTAVRVLTGGAQAQAVTLTIASQRGLTDDALAAFPTAAAFEDGTRAGPGPEAPAPKEGAAPLGLTVDADAGTVTVDLATLPAPAAFVLLPAVAEGALPRDLDVAFEPVRPEDVRTTASAPAGLPQELPPPAPAPPPAQAAPVGQDGFVLPGVPLAAEAPSLPGLAAAPALAPAPAAGIAPPVLPGPVAAGRPIVPSSVATEAVTRSRTLGLLAVGLAAVLVLAQQARPRRARLSLHGLPAPGAEPPVTSARAAAARPPRLR
jgi:hypothetical protein